MQSPQLVSNAMSCTPALRIWKVPFERLIAVSKLDGEPAHGVALSREESQQDGSDLYLQKGLGVPDCRAGTALVLSCSWTAATSAVDVGAVLSKSVVALNRPASAVASVARHVDRQGYRASRAPPPARGQRGRQDALPA